MTNPISSDPETEKQVRLLLSEGEKIKAILIVRQRLGLNLREGKELVESLASYSRAEVAAVDIEAEIRADEQKKVREAVAESIESLINDSETGAGQSAINETLRLTAKIARGVL